LIGIEIDCRDAILLREKTKELILLDEAHFDQRAANVIAPSLLLDSHGLSQLLFADELCPNQKLAYSVESNSHS